MTPLLPALAKVWAGVAVHLWQTALVLSLLFLIAPLLRRAPARAADRFWWLGLAKVFLPLALIRPFLEPLWNRVFAAGGTTGSWLAGTDAILRPAAIAGVEMPSLAVYPILAATLFWMAGASVVALRSFPRRGEKEKRASYTVGLAERSIRLRVEKAARIASTGTGAIRISAEPRMPAVTGLARPVIVLPESLIRELPARELAAILLHENEHRRRFEPVRELIARTAAVLFFFFPPLWPLLRKIREGREFVCDEAVILRGISSESYAAVVARALRLALEPPRFAAALVGDGPSLFRRRLLKIERQRSVRMTNRHRIVLATAAFALAVTTLLPIGGSVPALVAGDSADTSPRIVEQTAPVYPEAERAAGVEGKVVLSLVVGKDGSIGEIGVVEEVEGLPAFTENSRAALLLWTFEPGTKNGHPAEMTVFVPFQFRLTEKETAEEK